jgi:hypothetical protein
MERRRLTGIFLISSSALLTICAASRRGRRRSKKKSASPRIRSAPRRHLKIKRNKNRLREIEMTKVVSFAFAFVLFAPVAAVTLMQAANIFA